MQDQAPETAKSDSNAEVTVAFFRRIADNTPPYINGIMSIEESKPLDADFDLG